MFLPNTFIIFPFWTALSSPLNQLWFPSTHLSIHPSIRTNPECVCLFVCLYFYVYFFIRLSAVAQHSSLNTNNDKRHQLDSNPGSGERSNSTLFDAPDYLATVAEFISPFFVNLSILKHLVLA